MFSPLIHLIYWPGTSQAECERWKQVQQRGKFYIPHKTECPRANRKARASKYTKDIIK